MIPIEITVITPVFNGVNYIEDCIKNVVNQNCLVSEHLIIDGASTDGTVEIIKEWAIKYPHITLVSEKDNGQSDAMNKGIKLAKGKVISYLNVDDYYEPNVLNRVSAIFKSNPEHVFVCGNLNIWDCEGKLKHFHRPTNIKLVEMVTHLYEWPYNPSAYFYQKSLHDQIGMYNVDNELCMDYEFVLKAAAVADFIHVDETWGNFVMVEGSKTQVSHHINPEFAANKGKELRREAYLRLSDSDQKIADRLVSEASKSKHRKASLLSKIKVKIKQMIRS